MLFRSVFVIGGGQIYRAALPLAQTCWVTEIAAECAGDTTFPELPASEWKKTVLREVPATDTTPMLTFCRYDRI